VDAVTNRDDLLAARVEGAQSALAQAVTKANLMGDPLGQALEAMSHSLGAQLALHQANAGHFRDVSARLDRQLADTITQGEQALQARRIGIVEGLAPELAKAVAANVRSWRRTVTFRTALYFGGVAVVLALVIGIVGYDAGWNAGNAMGLTASGALASAVSQAGPDAEAALVAMVRANKLDEAWALCRKSAILDKEGRRICQMPMWVDPRDQPKG